MLNIQSITNFRLYIKDHWKHYLAHGAFFGISLSGALSWYMSVETLVKDGIRKDVICTGITLFSICSGIHYIISCGKKVLNKSIKRFIWKIYCWCMVFLGFLGKTALVHTTIIPILMVFRGRGIAESSDTEMEGTPTTNGQMSESREANIYAAEAKIHGSQDAPQPRPPVRSHTSPKVNQGLRSIDSVNAGKYAEHQRLRLSCE